MYFFLKIFLIFIKIFLEVKDAETATEGQLPVSIGRISGVKI